MKRNLAIWDKSGRLFFSKIIEFRNQSCHINHFKQPLIFNGGSSTRKVARTRCEVKVDVILRSPLHPKVYLLRRVKNQSRKCSQHSSPRFGAEGKEACRTTCVRSFYIVFLILDCVFSPSTRGLEKGKFSNRLNINFGACVCVRTPLLLPRATLFPFSKDSRWCIES